MKHSNTLILFLTLLAGCTQQPYDKTKASEVASTIAETPLTDPEHWLPLIEVWACTDGSYQVRSMTGIVGYVVGTRDAALTARTNWAFQLAQFARKSAAYEPAVQAPCSQRIQ